MSASPPPASPLPESIAAVLESLVSAGQPTAQQLMAVARWRLACGDGRGAARWQRWSVEAPDPAALQAALRHLLLLLGEPKLAARLGDAEGWPAVLQALQHGQPEQALALQRQASQEGTPIDLALSRELAALWQRQGHPREAIPLLLGIARQATTPPICNCIANLYEQLGEPAEAAPWWDRSLQLDPGQPAAL